MKTPYIESTNSAIVEAFIEEPGTDLERLERAKFIRGIWHLQVAAEKRAMMAELLLVEGATDPRHHAANTCQSFFDELTWKTIASADVLAASPAWGELVAKLVPEWEAFRIQWEADRAAEQAAADAFNQANDELTLAERKFTEAVAGGDDKQLATARARLLEARNKVESSRRSLR
jgi:hypothetical protein